MAEIQNKLSRRERQIMDILLEIGEGSVNDVLSQLPNPPSYSTVRALLGKMESKGLLTHREQGARYIYIPAITRKQAGTSAAQRLVRTFFGGSAIDAVNTIINLEAESLGPEEIDKLEAMIARAKSRSARKNE